MSKLVQSHEADHWRSTIFDTDDSTRIRTQVFNTGGQFLHTSSYQITC